MPNALPPCPDTPNCYRTSVAFPFLTEVVFDAALQAIREHRGLFSGKAQDVDVVDSDIKAVFKIGSYLDDLAISVESVEGGITTLNIRSASRVGHADYGVNRRRVRAILKTIRAILEVT